MNNLQKLLSQAKQRPKLFRFKSGWRSWRTLALMLVGLLAALGLSITPSTAQNLPAQGRFCTSNTNPIDRSSQGRSYGDPHINTYDGLHYSFQTVGEYILSQSADRSFQVQARQQQVSNSNNLSLNTAVAMNVCGQRVAVYATNAPDNRGTTLWVNGNPTRVDGDALALENGGEVQNLGSGRFAILWPSGDQVRLNTITIRGNQFLNVAAILRPSHRNEVEGLLGNFNGNPDDDLIGRDGQQLPPQSTYSLATNTLSRALPRAIPVRQVSRAFFDNLNRQFGDSWLVRPGESLFDYSPGQSPETFANRGFPNQIFSLNNASAADLDAAVATCEEAGVEAELMDGCVFDVAATGESSFADAAVNAIAETVVRQLQDRAVDEIRRRVPFGIPRLPF